MMRTAVVLLLLAGVALAKNVHKRNAYGDELIVPAGDTIVVEEQPATYAEEAPVVVADSAGYGPVVVADSAGYGPVPAVQVADVVAAMPVEHSGYRNKRNAYGDELVVPDVVVEESPIAAVPEYEETAPAVIAAPAPVPMIDYQQPLPVVQSGYRFKREALNAYGDELVIPQEALFAEKDTHEEQALPELQAPEVEAPAEPVDAAVEQSGYRVKRNIYGDELILPAAAGIVPQQIVLPYHFAEAEAIAIEQGRYAALPMVVDSGYRTRAARAHRGRLSQ